MTQNLVGKWSGAVWTSFTLCPLIMIHRAHDNQNFGCFTLMVQIQLLEATRNIYLMRNCTSPKPQGSKQGLPIGRHPQRIHHLHQEITLDPVLGRGWKISNSSVCWVPQFSWIWARNKVSSWMEILDGALTFAQLLIGQRLWLLRAWALEITQPLTF